jgi:hypothetical protein
MQEFKLFLPRDIVFTEYHQLLKYDIDSIFCSCTDKLHQEYHQAIAIVGLDTSNII